MHHTQYENVLDYCPMYLGAHLIIYFMEWSSTALFVIAKTSSFTLLHRKTQAKNSNSLQRDVFIDCCQQDHALEHLQ